VLFAGGKPRSIQRNKDSALVLDASDILDLLKEGAGPVILDESAMRKPEKGQPRGTAPRHPNMTAAQWKKVPDWLENPVAVFASATSAGDLVFCDARTGQRLGGAYHAGPESSGQQSQGIDSLVDKRLRQK
jgi:hypothetical protein